MELQISGPDGFSNTVELRKETFTVGRAFSNDLAFPEDLWLSRFHFSFERKLDQWFVKDLGSRNGTVVNGKLIKQPHQLRPGDRIDAGHFMFRVAEEVPNPNHVVSFVPVEPNAPSRDMTMVTSLDEVLDRTSRPVGKKQESSLHSAHVVRALIRAGQELASHQPLEGLFEVILDLALSAVRAKRGVILTLEGNDLLLRASRGKGFVISTAVRDRVLRDKCSIFIADAQQDDLLRNHESIVFHGVRSVLAVPLQTGERVIGLIYVDNGNEIRLFVQEDVDLLTVMANVAAIRIEHARLVAIEQQEKVTAFELAQASQIQQSLLPLEPPVIDGYDLDGLQIPTRTVGGDYYDFLPYTDGKLAIIVADVSGKGLPAAILMSSLQARVQMLVERMPDPAAALTSLNKNLAERCPPDRFITLFYGLLDVQTGKLQYGNAGHNPPLILRADRSVELLEDGDLVLGVVNRFEYRLRETTLAPGEMLVLYSDGVTEARNPKGEEFGEAGLQNFLTSRGPETPTVTAHALAQHVRRWREAPTLEDDFTVVVVKRRQPAEAPAVQVQDLNRGVNAAERPVERSEE
jgi:phosphoserine phosphatase RsbU/P